MKEVSERGTTMVIRIEGSNEKGYTAIVGGISLDSRSQKKQEVLHWTNTHLVLKSKGWGSRNSGLMSYYPPEITVYAITETLSDGRLRIEKVTGWENGRERKVRRPVAKVA